MTFTFRRCGHSGTGPLFYMFPMEKRTRFFITLKKCEKLQILEITEMTLYPERYLLFLHHHHHLPAGK